jgi:ectoine hydroxylase-related dioxygenase (phytanoyl-CoA dioxygenase family)
MSVALESQSHSFDGANEMSDLKRHWDSEGYVVVRRLIEPVEVARLRELCEDVLTQWYQRDPQSGQPAAPDATSMRHLNHPDYFRHNPQGLIEMLNVIADPRVLDVARQVLGDEPLFRCTSLFMNPKQHGGDGHWHRDSQFGTKSDEEEKQFLFGGQRCDGIQLQLALVPSEDSEVVPGSHLRWDTDEEYRIRKADGGKNCRSNDMPGALRAALQPGDAVAFNSMALHRGRYHADKPRRTLMLTYTTPRNAPHDYFSNQPWFLEEGHLDGVSRRTRAFVDRFIEQFKADWAAPAVV